MLMFENYSKEQARIPWPLIMEPPSGERESGLRGDRIIGAARSG